MGSMKCAGPEREIREENAVRGRLESERRHLNIDRNRNSMRRGCFRSGSGGIHAKNQVLK